VENSDRNHIYCIILEFFWKYWGKPGQPQDSLSPGRDMYPEPISVYELSVWRWRRGLRTCLEVFCCYLFSVASCPVTGADFGVMIWLCTLRQWWAAFWARGPNQEKLEGQCTCNIEALSFNPCCCGIAINITYSEELFVALGIQHAMLCVISYLWCLRLYHISTLYIINSTVFEKVLLNIKCFCCLFNFCLKHFPF
jgi:hypothetical protein